MQQIKNRVFKKLRKEIYVVNWKVNRIFYKLQKKQIVHFLHIGKTGGTAIKYALRNDRVTRTSALLLHSHSTRLRDIPVGDKCFFFLRDPIDRFASGFYSRKRKGYPRLHNSWSQDEEKAFAIFSTPMQLAVALSSEDEIRRKEAIIAMRSIGHVKDSFWKWFESEAYLCSRKSDILFIGAQEDLNRDFKFLLSKLNLPETLELPVDDINSHRNPPGLDRTFDRQAINNLKKWYCEDYLLIELCGNLEPVK